ncbi:glutamate--tRNA ligase [Candidatus Puniceispirillum marinum]|uniref:Glutamate--tRNA ligase n=1 Tax=Puniceispirillum marinum (strain IMCC1322) TaxID=488538 RepID=D5BR32_PUNMI|nr:glutamate--tRNA ligase [Candidatus Puniceispirillum marinum]ADE38746.1 Glutamyl- and glutaminyl-tRNA synthetase [Candidatus Puniceispirillum marinum IMCC1322]
MNVVTRFAPSPTGYLHVGGARTALFNWLFARHHGGTYLLRIEDTDRQRSTEDAIKAIHDGLAWLGLGGDAPAVSQSAQAPRHVEVAKTLIERGAAYRCYLTADELTTIREEASKNGTTVRSPWRDRTDAPTDMPYVVRMKMPDDGATTIDDAVQGSVTVQNSMLDDMVILRADGTPTYMLAVVVDDHDMGVTHVIRGDDHLNNAFRQYMVYHGMGWDVPIFAHIPLIHGADGAKLSKRHGALGVDAYRDMGFLADAMVNYLLRLGWGHGDDEIISRENAVKWFSLDKVGRAPSRFDIDKLYDMNAHYLRHMAPEELVRQVLSMTNASSPDAEARVMTLLPLLRERAKTHLDIGNAIGFLLHDGAPVISDDAQALLTVTAKENISRLMQDLADSDWELEALKQNIKDWLDQNNLKMKDIGLPLRAAVTGMQQSPSIIDVIATLGADEVRARVAEACK